MTLTFKAFNEICDLVMNFCGVDEDTAELVASGVMTIVYTGGVVDDETATDQLATILKSMYPSEM